jgi:hypothetical protein
MEKMKKKIIVITSIFSPTEAVQAFSRLNDYELVVVGDKKTPTDWNCDNVKYLSIEKQSEIGQYLNKILPYNHYCRKMLGYIYAIKQGADLIVDTDDDNIPKENWQFPDFSGNFLTIPEYRGFINIYELYTDQLIWPRGLPLKLITKKNDLESELTIKPSKLGVWQGLADEDPDVDAIYRLTSDKPCYFKDREPIVLGKGTITPFNTQNTIIIKELFPLLYLPTSVSFRFTDILRGLIAQPIMWLYDYHLGFTNATVVQKRNPHDYYKDFESELSMYKHTENVIEIVRNAITVTKSISSNLFNAYTALEKNGIVLKQELKTLEEWLKDIEQVV